MRPGPLCPTCGKVAHETELSAMFHAQELGTDAVVYYLHGFWHVRDETKRKKNRDKRRDTRIRTELGVSRRCLQRRKARARRRENRDQS